MNRILPKNAEKHDTFYMFLLPDELFGDDGIYSTVLVWRYLVIKPGVGV